MRTRTAIFILTGCSALIMAWTLGLAHAKLHSNATNALDLGIYTQVAWQSSHGHLFGFTIHPHLYLGDHVELLFLLAAIPFRFIPSPLTLVALQCLAVIGAGFALFYFARRFGSTISALGWAGLFLFNPFALNALAFEFHAILFGLPFAFLALQAYHDRRFGRLWIWVILLLLAREDLALFVAGIALLALLERRTWKWWVWPGLVSVAWLVGAMILAGTINGEGYKFFTVLQATTGTSTNIASHLLSLFTPANLVVIIALLLPLLGLPILAWRWLALLVLPLVGISAAGFGSGDLVLQTHYAAFFLPGLFASAVIGWKNLWASPPHWLHRFEPHTKPFVIILLGCVSLYSLLTFGPTIGAVHAQASVSDADKTKANYSLELAKYTPISEAVISGYGTLPLFSARPYIYAAHYAFLGKRQYSEKPYPLPANIDLVHIDAEDFVVFEVQYAKKDSRKTEYASGAERLNTLLAEHNLHLSNVTDTLLTFSKDGKWNKSFVDHEPATLLPIGTPFSLFSKTTALQKNASSEVAIDLIGQTNSEPKENYQAELKWLDGHNRLIEKRYLPLGYGLEPTTSWKADEQVTTHFRLIAPAQADHAQIRAIVPSGYLTLNGWRSAVLAIDKKLDASTPPFDLVIR